jgi:hypothetical protein
VFATIRRVLLLVGLVALSACASIVEGTEQSVTIMTEPSGAACKLERQGVVVSLVNPTPGTARIGKSKENVTVLCDKDGHESAAAPLASEFQAMTFGNLIFGGIIGVAVDAGTGAMNKYPDSVNLLLPPKSFPSVADRDAFYERAKAAVSREAASALSTAQRSCSPDNRAQCEAAIKEVEAKRDAKIAELEAKRLQARTL